MVKCFNDNNSPQRVISHSNLLDYPGSFESPSRADHFNYPEVTPKHHRGLETVSIASKQIFKQKSSPFCKNLVRHDSLSGKNT